MRVRHAVVFALASLSLTAEQPPGKETALGERLAEKFRQQTTPIDRPLIQDYADRLGQRLGAQMPDAKFPFTFSVIAHELCRPVQEPAALPGGYVFVYLPPCCLRHKMRPS